MPKNDGLIEDLEEALRDALADFEWHSAKVAAAEEAILSLRKTIDDLEDENSELDKTA